MTTYTWRPDLTFVCTDCRRLSYASDESLRECRNELADDEKDTSDADLVGCWEFCLSCAEGEELEGEHVKPEPIDTIVAEAEEAFWNVVIKGLNVGSMTSGDFPPDATEALQTAMRDAIRTWVLANKPSLWLTVNPTAARNLNAFIRNEGF
jgi:hypothetical protein